MTGIKPIDPNKARISRNVDKMVAAGAPDSDVEAYLQSEGLKPVNTEFGDVEGGSSHANAANKYDSMDAAANGLLGGFAGEVAAGLRSGAKKYAPALLGPKAGDVGTYDQELSKEEEGARRYREQHGMANAASEIAGSLPLAAISGGSSALAKLGALRPVVEGGALGALYGAGNAQQGHRGMGALVGGGLGAVAAPLTLMAGRALKTVAEATPGVNTVGRALHLLPQPQDKADQLILQRIAQDETTPEALAAEVRSRAPTKPETLIDVGGQNVTGVGKLAIQSPGKGRQQFAEMVADRQANAPGRISQDLESAGMNPLDRYATKEALLEAKRRTATPLYEAALKGNPIDDDAINAWLETPEGHAAFNIAQGIRRKEAEASALEAGRALTPKDYELPQIYKMTTSPGTPGTSLMVPGGAGINTPLTGKIERVSVPDDRTLHYMKLALDDMVKYGYVPPGGSASTRNFASKSLSKAYRERIGQLIPGYDDAAQVFSGGQHMEDAFDSGLNFLKEDAAKSSGDVANMTQAEKDLYRLGAGNAVRKAADVAPDGSDIAKRVFGSPEKRAQIAAALNDPQAAEALSREMDRERRMAVVNRLQGGSQTQPMSMELDDAHKALGVLSQLASGRMLGAAWRATQRFGNGMTPEVTDALSSRLLSGRNGQAELLSALEALSKAAQKPHYSKSRALSNLMAAMSGMGAGASVR